VVRIHDQPGKRTDIVKNRPHGSMGVKPEGCGNRLVEVRRPDMRIPAAESLFQSSNIRGLFRRWSSRSSKQVWKLDLPNETVMMPPCPILNFDQKRRCTLVARGKRQVGSLAITALVETFLTGFIARHCENKPCLRDAV
jgi:hypothetical protein